ncbi:MAG: YceI family protein [Parvicellaceae bacterium]|tara:strand:- start:1198 stop:1854 length:657 start_codon:yes stop_codon:yes gene_type:complete
MNNQIKVLVVGAIFLVIGFLIFSNWGNPESELEKTNVEEVKTQDFASILGTTWINNSADPTSSEISFDIEGLKDTKGFFKDFDIVFKVSDNDPEQAKIKVSINVKSINTDNDIRDEELIGSDFFNTDKFPLIEFYSKGIKKIEDKYSTKGIINMMGESKDLAFSFEHKGITNNSSGFKVAIFEGTFEIDRTNFGMEHVVSVGDDVAINFYCELIEDRK